MTKYLIRYKEIGKYRILSTWTSSLRAAVLTQIIDTYGFRNTICFASKVLSFREENEIIKSANNGNYIGMLELLSEFDTFLEEHFKLYVILKMGSHRIYRERFVGNLLN